MKFHYTYRLTLSFVILITTILLPLVSAHAATRDEVIYYVNDPLGSAIAAYDEDGQLCWEEAYTPYGYKTEREDSFNREGCGVISEERGYTGHTEDRETDLVYMQQRYYDPTIGRFLSLDPVSPSVGNVKTLNRYSYAVNNPYKYVDPNGESAVRLLTTSYKIGRKAFVQYKRTGKLDGQSLKDIGLDEIAGIAEDLNTVFSGSSTPLERVIAAAELVSGLDVPKGAGKKSRNKPSEPLPEADGHPHSIIEKPGKAGQYTTHNGDGTWKQYRGSGQDHGGIPRPNVKEAGKNVTPDGSVFIDKGRVRPARPDEIPGS